MIAAEWRNHHRFKFFAAAAVGLLSLAVVAQAKQAPAKPAKQTLSKHRPTAAVRPVFSIPNGQLAAATWNDIDGWAADDHAAAFATFLVSCKAILKRSSSAHAARPMFNALHDVCARAVSLPAPDAKTAREFFEQNFRPIRISPVGDPDGFLTGYYEPILDGRRQPDGPFAHPLYRKPGDLLPGGRMLGSAKFSPAKTKGKRIAKRLVTPYFDRARIEDGALNGRNLEICYLKDPVDAFFTHIQGSVRVKLDDGSMLRLNYVAANGQPYTAVGKFLIERKIYTREEMSMEKIREWMNANPEGGRDLRRLNKSYVFFRETGLSETDEPIGAQGVSLTPGRSIAVDRKLHVYGTPFFIDAKLPIDGDAPTTPFRRLMVAQDTGGAIVGPARADIYWGAGVEAGVISGRFKNPGKFVMLVPNSIDPFATKREMPLPLPRPRPDIPVATKTDTPAVHAKTTPPAATAQPVAPAKTTHAAPVAHAPTTPAQPVAGPVAKKSAPKKKDEPKSLAARIFAPIIAPETPKPKTSKAKAAAPQTIAPSAAAPKTAAPKPGAPKKPKAAGKLQQGT